MERLGISGDPGLRGLVGKIIGKLAVDPLPTKSDVRVEIIVLPRPGPAWSRRIGGYSLWLVFRFDDERVTVLGVTGKQPERV